MKCLITILMLLPMLAVGQIELTINSLGTLPILSTSILPPLIIVSLADGVSDAASSTNGVIWILRDTGSANGLDAVAYGNRYFVAVGYGASARSVYSTNGTTWSTNTYLPQLNFYTITYGGGKFVTIAYGTTNTFYCTTPSTGADMWIPSPILTVAQLWYCVTYGNGKFVAVGGTNAAAYSGDGINWTNATMPISQVLWRSIVYGGSYGAEKFVAVGGNTNTAYSSDGINWTSSIMPHYCPWQCMAYGNGKFVALGYGVNNAAYSGDGINWTNCTLSDTANWMTIGYVNNQFVAIGNGSAKVVYSGNGINWTNASMPSSKYWHGVQANR